jgi:2-desacetyl-2-hydroxyethyl bacteriochlorophyllide A dehydrogenase
MTRDARAFWVVAPDQGELRPETLPEPGPGEILVQTLYSGVSRGTESLVFRGEVPPSEWSAMRAPFQEGRFPGPVKYGYQSVGRVEEEGEAGGESLLGREVFCLFPHQTHFVVPREAVVPLPSGLPAPRAVLAANMETAVNAHWDASPRTGDRVVVIGAGVVGLLIAWLTARIPGVELTLVDVNRDRARVAAVLDLPFATTLPDDDGADLVVHASGNPAGLEGAMELLGPEGTLVEVSWFGDRPVQLPLGGAFHSRRLTLRSSQVGRLPPERAPRWTHRRRMELALNLLRDPVLDHLVTSESGFDELPSVMAGLADSPGGTLCHRVRYSTS